VTAQAEGSLDKPLLAQNAALDVNGAAWPLRSARMVSKPLMIVA